VVLQLVAQGEDELDEPVDTYPPGLVRGHGSDGRRITVRQLLQKTSRLPDYGSIVLEAGETLTSIAPTPTSSRTTSWTRRSPSAGP
jgi:D-alanyl-D-alanine carboxypeptidase